MFTKIFNKNAVQSPLPAAAASAPPTAQVEEDNAAKGVLTDKDINPRVVVHYGIPSAASVLSYDSVQNLLAVGTLDGRIKVIGGHNIEGLLVSPKQIPFKYLEFLQNQGFLVSVSSENEIQVWDLDQRRIAASLQWESSITAFSVIECSSYMYVGDEYGMVSVLKLDHGEGRLVQMPYYVPTNSITEASGKSSLDNCSVVGVLSQPSSRGNRVLIAYEDGLIIVWDVSEDKVILVRGNKDLHLKSKIAANSHKDIGVEHLDDGSEYEQEEKEISSLCWTSNDGSILAVGYVDGDILLWDLSTVASGKGHQAEKSLNNAIKLQLSSDDRRLPVIVLHWSANRLIKDCGGDLFVYGGDAIGSDEVLTILRLDWSSGLEHLKCISRVDLTLNGSFADMVLLPALGTMENSGTMILTNPGQLHFYDDSCLFSSRSQQEGKNSLSSLQYPAVIPTIEPNITVGKLFLLHKHGKFLKAISEAANASEQTNWPLTGGVPNGHFVAENYQVERVYVAGYLDGSVTIWDATYPTFSHIYVLGPEVKGINIVGLSAPVSALEFCPFNLSVALGNELGMVHLYKLIGDVNETSLKFVTANATEVHALHEVDGPQCKAVFSLVASPICTLKFANFGARLAVGFNCGRVAVLDIGASSVLFISDTLSESCSLVNCLAVKSFSDAILSMGDVENTESREKEKYLKSEIFVMTKDAYFAVIDSKTGSIICSQSIQPEKQLNVISMYIIEDANSIIEVYGEKHPLNTAKKREAEDISAPLVACSGTDTHTVELEASAETACLGQNVDNVILLLCCEDALYLYQLKSSNKVDSEPIHKVNLSKPCCWATTFKKDDKECGLIIIYHNGVIEVRSLPGLEVVGESSVMSILRWNFKTNMDKTICSSDSGQIMLVNGCEYASVSLLASENDFRIPESLPLLHNKAHAAAAADFANSLSPHQKTSQSSTSGFLGGFIKGFQVSKVEHSMHLPVVSTSNLTHLESIFSSPPFLKPSIAFPDDQKVVELNIDDIDIDIDGPLIVSSSSGKSQNDARDKGTERERLFEGATTDSKPRMRTAEEIKAKYRKGDASSAASQARDKLAERGEKLERLSLRTQELQSGAENFASMANQLAKQMEKQKWWNI